MDARMKARRTLELDLRQAVWQRVRAALPAAGRSSGTTRSSASRRCCAGIIPSAAWSRRPSSFRSRRRPASSTDRRVGAANGLRRGRAWPDGSQGGGQPLAGPVQERQSGQIVVNALAASGLPAHGWSWRSPSRCCCRTTRQRSRRCTAEELGVRIAMDDFGTGYSSLSYLRRSRSTRSRSTARSSRIRREGRLVVHRPGRGRAGQGLQDHDDRRGRRDRGATGDARALGCTEVQGYLFSPPKPATEIVQLFPPRRARARSVA